ncbi:MAG: cysteine peptidase family C39 domain-containing protein [Minicystis sp.]
MEIAVRLALVALTAAASVASCARCGSSAASSTGAAADAPAASGSAAAPPIDPDLPEIKDTGRGRATAALRALLTANGIAFDAATLERECKVDDDGASIDDLEDVAAKYGLDARQIILPPEHVLLPGAKLLPGILIVDGAGDDDASDFILVWRVDGDRVLVMDPADGRRWVSRAELLDAIHLHTMTVPEADWARTQTDPGFLDALRARLAAIGVDGDKAKGLVDKSVGAPTFRGVAALDAAVRQLEVDPQLAAGDPAGFLAKAYACSAEDQCAAGVDAIQESLWTARPAPKGSEGQVEVHGAVLLAIAGKKAPSP